jgi:phospholipase/carboxylesterase
VQTDNKTYTTFDNGWIVRIRPPEQTANARILLLIHGWTGDENSMWVFGRQIPGNYCIFAPRGPVSAPEGGYGWTPHSIGRTPEVKEFDAITVQLLDRIKKWTMDLKIDSDQPINLMGFSQGTALVYSILIRHPDRVNKTASLAGFLPYDAVSQLSPGRLSKKQIFIAHGSLDETVRVAKAHEAVKVLTGAGAEISYCEEEVGHKLSSGCFKGLMKFFEIC